MDNKTGNIEINCLKCNKPFLSTDKRKNRICKKCSTQNDRQCRHSGSIPRSHKTTEE